LDSASLEKFPDGLCADQQVWVETQAMRPSREPEERQSPTAVRMGFRSSNDHLVQMGTYRIIADPQQPRERSLKAAIFASIACGNRDAPQR
jgi:hypothetical protein